jgi:phosphate:Na+ symporter
MQIANEFHWFEGLVALLAGIGLFVFAVKLMEESIRAMAGRTFKLYLQKATANPWSALLISTFLTGVLQGSSVVMVILLALVGAGVLPLRNAIAVILGANLGTTLDSWVIAAIGFKMPLEQLAYPAIIFGAWLHITAKADKWRSTAGLLFGFGLFFISLGLMKVSVADQLLRVDPAWLSNTPLWQFALIGVGITALIQSSLATMVLAMSALHAGLVGFEVAAALVIGSEIGTTLKLFAGAAGDSAVKKRLAWANLIINSVTSVVVFIALKPLVVFVLWFSPFEDRLFSLVTFQTLMNVVSILIFLPWMNRFANWLEQRFEDRKNRLTAFIDRHPVADPVYSIELLRKEVLRFLHWSCVFNLQSFGIRTEDFFTNADRSDTELAGKMAEAGSAYRYVFIKDLQGEIQLYYLGIRKSGLSDELVQPLEHLMASVRSAMHSVKSVHDISENIQNLYQSSKEIKYRSYREIRQKMKTTYVDFHGMLLDEDGARLDRVVSLYEKIQHDYSGMLNEIYDEASLSGISNSDFTTLMNFNRELFSSHRAMVFAFTEFFLEPAEADRFTELVRFRD